MTYNKVERVLLKIREIFTVRDKVIISEELLKKVLAKLDKLAKEAEGTLKVDKVLLEKILSQYNGLRQAG